MTDTLSKAERSRRMSLIKSKDTKPELFVRSLIHSLGYRYRLHVSNLPGKPDIVFPARRKIIFVHGCFWHRHTDPRCTLSRLPKSKLDFWTSKLQKNYLRDQKVLQLLSKQGWDVLVIWECQILHYSRLKNRIIKFLNKESG